jgi:hypothetical protein
LMPSCGGHGIQPALKRLIDNALEFDPCLVDLGKEVTILKSTDVEASAEE